MRRPGPSRSARPPKPEKQAPAGSRRDRVAVLLAIVTIACLGAALFLAKGTHFLMPGPLANAHGAIDNCGACHTKTGGGKLSWIHSVVDRDPLADSKACLTCHKMPDTALNAHGAPDELLQRSTRRLTKIAAATPAPLSALAQNIAFPTHDVRQGGLYCATCHQEHKGANFDLNKVSAAQCQSCHVVKFDSFDGNHPKFDNYPFGRRTRIIYDHAGHFGKHFPEVASKDAEKRIPATCSTCHSSREDKRVMAVAPFEQTCTTCHLDQIVGKERVSGPKGIAFLTLPGIDVDTLKEKNASIGEWPDASDAELTPFMKAMISRNERGRALIRTVNGLNLQDLSGANDQQIEAVANLVWEIKGLFYSLISGKASDVLGDLNIGGGAQLSPGLVADLTASLPRDVVISAHQEWLPELGTEMANRQEISEAEQSGWSAAITESRLAGSVSPEELSGQGRREAGPRLSEGVGGSQAAAGAAEPLRLAQAQRGPDQTDDLLYPNGGAPAPSVGNAAPPPVQAEPAAPAQAPAQAPAPRPATVNIRADGGTDAPAPRPQNRGGDQTDDLLFPDGGAPEAPGGGIPAFDSGVVDTALPAPDAPADAPADLGGVAAPDGAQPRIGPIVVIQSDIDPESWAEYGGWYRQDYGIFYRPTGHKDKFIYSWLFLTGPQAPKGDASPEAAVFDYLTGKDAQGSCTKCHSVDDIRGKGRLVNFAPPKVETKQGRFTNFVHEPHFGIMENRGCLTCHSLEKGRPYLKSYEQSDPRNFVSNFGAVQKELCQSCHTSSMAGQDCLTCHKYHVNDVLTPIMNTRIPLQ